MSKGSKLNRKKRRSKKDPTYSAFIRNKWDGKEPYEEFVRREFKLWNNMSSKFKRPKNERDRQSA